MTIPLEPPSSTSYFHALKEAKAELAKSVADLGEAQNRALELEQRIADLRQTVSVLAKLCGEKDMDVEESLGLTDAIRSVFVTAGKEAALTPQDVRLRLESQGFNTRRYGNLLASIHTVIKRLENKHEIVCTGTKRDVDKPSYRVTDQGIAAATVKGIGEFLSTYVIPKLTQSKK